MCELATAAQSPGESREHLTEQRASRRTPRFTGHIHLLTASMSNNDPWYLLEQLPHSLLQESKDHASSPQPVPAGPPAGTNLFDFLDVAVVVTRSAALHGLDALVVLEQGGDLRAQGQCERGSPRPPQRPCTVPAAGTRSGCPEDVSIGLILPGGTSTCWRSELERKGQKDLKSLKLAERDKLRFSHSFTAQIWLNLFLALRI